MLSAALQLLESVDQVLASARLRLEWAYLCRRRGSIEQGEALRAQGAAQLEAAGCAHVIEGIERSCAFGWPP
jgi:hypothetical protein